MYDKLIYEGQELDAAYFKDISLIKASPSTVPNPDLFTPLFANNEQGFFYDPNDLSTMFQNAAGTIPVTDVGQPVGLIQDKSGRNNHAKQTTSASRPILRKNAVTGANYLEFDGSDDFLTLDALNFNGKDKLSLFVGQKTNVPSGTGVLVETGSYFGNPRGGFGLFSSIGGTTQDPIPIVGGGVSAEGSGNGEFSFGNLVTNNFIRTITLRVDLTKSTVAQQANIRANGELKIPTATTGVIPGSKFTTVSMNIGRRSSGSIPFNGHIYTLVCTSRSTTDAEVIAIEKEIAKQTGVPINV